MSDGVPSDYCPPIDASNYLDSGIEYPAQETKDKGVLIEPGKEGKSVSPSTNLSNGAVDNTLDKSPRVLEGSSNIERKVPSRTPANLSVQMSSKNNRSISFQSNMTRKVGNTI